MLILPTRHIQYGSSDAVVAVAAAMEMAAWLAEYRQLPSYNLITSCGRPATQSVPHIHVHLVPRTTNDGLALPWYSGKSKKGH